MRTISKLFPCVPACLVLAACQGGDPVSPIRPSLTEGVIATAIFPIAFPFTGDNNTPAQERFKVCKYGSSANFSYSADDLEIVGNPDFTGLFSLNDGDCVLLATKGGLGANVTVTETTAQTGFHFDHLVVSGFNTTPTQNGATADGFISGGPGGLTGVVAEFFNARDNAGGQGCTPGYWKQPQHFDSWPTPYTPSTLFSAVFENAFPGWTLLQVLQNNGNVTGLEALGRHTVAALLNSASSGVNYGMTPAQVISAFNAVFPGTKTAYNQRKGVFAALNEAGCPLN